MNGNHFDVVPANALRYFPALSPQEENRRVNHNHSIVIRYFIAMINFDFRSDVGAHVIRSFIKESEVIPTEMEIMIVRY